MLGGTTSAAFVQIDSELDAVSHQALHEFVRAFDLSSWSVVPGESVALLCDGNSQTTAVLVALLTKYCAVPLSADAPPHVTASLLQQSGARCLLSAVGTRESMRSRAKEATQSVNIPFVELDITVDGALTPPLMPNSRTSPRRWYATAQRLAGRKKQKTQKQMTHQNSEESTCLLLFTSGTTSRPKCVPFSLTRLRAAACAVTTTLILTGTDVNLSLLPLFHVGGIVVNMLAPLLSRGSALLLSRFDAAVVLSELSKPHVTWCHAVRAWLPPALASIRPVPILTRILHAHPVLLLATPVLLTTAHAHDARPAASMWMLLLECTTSQQQGVAKPSSLRLVRSAGSILTHERSQQLRRLFDSAAVLPCYGMTECLPITSPPLRYALERPGSVGPAVCDVRLQIRRHGDPPNLATEFGRDRNATAAKDEVGEVGVASKSLLFSGYREARVADSGLSDGWLSTGDLGCLDADGWLSLTGRLKECINRGGELLSPGVIEEALVDHPAINGVAMVFGVAHAVLQEVPAVAILDSSIATLEELRSFAADRLSSTQLPQLLVRVGRLPRNDLGKVRPACKRASTPTDDILVHTHPL